MVIFLRWTVQRERLHNILFFYTKYVQAVKTYNDLYITYSRSPNLAFWSETRIISPIQSFNCIQHQQKLRSRFLVYDVEV